MNKSSLGYATQNIVCVIFNYDDINYPESPHLVSGWIAVNADINPDLGW